jgi:hypothetical protein
MIDADEARKYLATALAELGIEMKSASEAVGMNHAYVQQYIRNGKPQWLPEPVRDGLVRAFGLDADKLRPPPKTLRPPRTTKIVGLDSQDHPQVNTPRYGQFIDDPSTLDLLNIWSRITDPAQRELAKRILGQMVNRTSSKVA